MSGRAEISGETMLETRDLSIEFGGVHAVDGVSFEVRRGEILSVIGPNGAGKTTLLNLVSRLYDPSEGRLFFEGRDYSRRPAHRVAAMGIARTFQNLELFDHATVLANLLMGRHPLRRTNLVSELLFLPAVRRQERDHRRAVERVIDLLDLQHYREQIVGHLPYGVRKVVELGRALCAEPRLLLLDEPSSGLNVEETEDMSFWIEDIRRELEVTVILVEHDMGLVGALSDRVLALADGRVLAEGTSDEVRADEAVRSAYLGES